MELMSCSKCGIVFNVEDLKEVFAEMGFLDLSKEELSEKEIIYWNWVDLEQTEEEYYKFCPICNSWEYHKKIKIEELEE